MKICKKMLSIFLSVLLVTLSVCCTVVATNEDVSIDVTEEKSMTGKELLDSGKVITQSIVTESSTAATLDRTASGLEFKLYTSGSVVASFTSNNYIHCLRLNLYVDGVKQDQIVLSASGTAEITLASGLEEGEHTFKIERISESQIGTITLDSLAFYGDIMALEDTRELSFDFFGDSITAGWGASTVTSGDCAYCLQDGCATYASYTANALNANYSVFAWSGWGVTVTGAADGVSKGQTVADVYDSQPKNPNADYIVVNLGTNDASKYELAGLTKQDVLYGFAAFANSLRSFYTQSTIIFVSGMMNDNADDFVAHAYQTLVDAGDENVYTVKLSRGVSGDSGHPNNTEQAVAGAELVEFINNIGNSKTLAGDINDDGEVNLSDVSSLAQKVAKWEVSVNEKVSDVDGDTKVTLTDVSTLAQYVAKWSNVQMTGDIYKNYYASEVDFSTISNKLKISSRATIDSNLLRMEWSYSGFELQGQFEGDITLTGLTTTNKDATAWAIIDGDDENPVLVRVNKGSSVEEVTIATGLEAGLHTVQFVKSSEAHGCTLTVKGIKYNGSVFAKPEDKTLSIDFIGDSITCASSLYSAEEQPDSVLRTDILKGYAYKTIKSLDADGNIISISGGSACTNSPNLQDYYPRTYYSATTPLWGFEKQSDIVVVALGTNDTPNYEGVTGGTIATSVLTQGIKDMVALVREKNPNAAIIWCYGAMDVRLESVYSSAMAEVKETDTNTYYLKLDRVDCTGVAGHPGPDGHTHNADKLVQFIKDNNLDK